MTKPRVPETDHGIQGEFNVTAYDQMQRRLRDKGWLETNELLNHGITHGDQQSHRADTVWNKVKRANRRTP
jgi:hypothetical protein